MFHAAVRIARASLVIAALVALPVHAQSEPVSTAAASLDYPTDLFYVATPDQLIRQGVDRLAGFMAAAPEASREVVLDFVTRDIAPYFDFAYMARWSAGPLYHRLDDGHKAALTGRLQDLFLDALARNLGSIQRPLPRVEVFPARQGQTMNDAIVYARVWGAGGPTRLEFRFYWNGFQWKVYDAVANGASAVAYYRRYFTALLRQYGPEALLR
jgi:phospholipid transport system substrate-binding protein